MNKEKVKKTFKKNKPRRLNEIWKLDRETKTITVLGLEGIAQFNAEVQKTNDRHD